LRFRSGRARVSTGSKRCRKINPDKFDYDDKQEATQQTAKQPGEAEKELTFMPAIEFQVLHELVLHDFGPG
jgi:hypothetical protein